MVGRAKHSLGAMPPVELVVIEDLVKYGEDLGYAKGIRQGISQAIREGFRQGIRQERLRMLSYRLGRVLTNHEQERLGARVAAMTSKRFYPLIFQASVVELEAWLAACETA